MSKSNFNVKFGLLSDDKKQLMKEITLEIDNQLYTKGYVNGDGHLAEFIFIDHDENPHIREDIGESKSVSIDDLIDTERFVNNFIKKRMENLDSQV